MSQLESKWSTCPHDCPSVCALEVEVLGERRIGRVRGAKSHPYTLGVICEKVARYAERIHHPERLLKPLKRKGEKGGGEWRPISWDDALDEVAAAFLKAEECYGAEAIWPYYYAGTMGLVQRDGINRLRHVKRYSREHLTICTSLSCPGWVAGAGALRGVDPREMRKSDLIVVWGGNPVNTQVNVMTHVALARKERGAKLAAVDVYNNGTMQQADLPILIKPGTDGALACAIMHVLFRDGSADRDYLNRYTDAPRELESHLSGKTPEWAADITGLPAEEIEAFARLIGETKRTYFRLGYGFTRSRNGAANMHAVLSIPAVTGAWAHEGGGALHANGALYRLDMTLIEGLDCADYSTRSLDQSRIGPVLTGDRHDLAGGPPVGALLIQNTNPVNVAPDQSSVRRGFQRADLFVCVHEQFMTETAQLADIVLPATMFLEHDDIYKSGGHTHLMLGPKVLDAPGECRSNHWLLCELAKRLGAKHPGFEMTEREIIGTTLKRSGKGTLEELEAGRWLDRGPPFEEAHFLTGFGHSDGKYRFKPDWTDERIASSTAPPRAYRALAESMPKLPDHWPVTDEASTRHPFRLVAAPARGFLNSSFAETPGSQRRERRPEILIHPEDAAAQGFEAGQLVRVGNRQGSVLLHLRKFAGVRRGVVIAEGIWPNGKHKGGWGINTLTSSDASAPFGGAAFHDTSVWIESANGELRAEEGCFEEA
ncbi:MAG: molybdopterin oxidoreductase family protein [Rhodomicrobium sp.]